MRTMTMALTALLLVIAATAFSGCEEKRDYAPGQPTLQYNRYDNSMDPLSQTAPLFP